MAKQPASPHCSFAGTQQLPPPACGRCATAGEQLQYVIEGLSKKPSVPHPIFIIV
ncbi:hypothetical protein [Kamptonema formosum]|uniref:hypothetical protein n=1 Tax=Kamptonema formosum TaxID=331992 RepID=UPI0003467A09|nr:hypothetical protein [Oscillatoria sp. PCC 10802]